MSSALLKRRRTAAAPSTTPSMVNQRRWTAYGRLTRRLCRTDVGVYMEDECYPAISLQSAWNSRRHVKPEPKSEPASPASSCPPSPSPSPAPSQPEQDEVAHLDYVIDHTTDADLDPPLDSTTVSESSGGQSSFPPSHPLHLHYPLALQRSAYIVVHPPDILFLPKDTARH
ncbi:hypothetical protein EVAR_96840_1 [Eumeta japonica]|uniref:Uncharacterized protein n=1 Tax=Eumeta variegata TaxID=151549 RepID=A0A4C1WB18_EUMVA|nr:hypothetical protein EVAR_96840_1 [Eumeta japonica]